MKTRKEIQSCCEPIKNGSNSHSLNCKGIIQPKMKTRNLCPKHKEEKPDGICESCLKADDRKQHTPTPWNIEKGMSLYPDALPYFVGRSQDGKMTPFQTAGSRAEANAAFIVRAVNAHEELLTALRHIVRVPLPLGGDKSPNANNIRSCYETAKQAIEKAEAH